jgi:hypothetical protein
MARVSPILVLVLVLIGSICFLAIDLHSKTQFIDSNDIVQSRNSELTSQQIDPKNDQIVVYNRIPKTGSTAFTHVMYDLAKGKAS